MNLGSIIGPGSICQPFPAGLATLSGGHQWRSIDPWIHQSRSMDPSGVGAHVLRAHVLRAVPSSLLSPMVLGVTPHDMGASLERVLSTFASKPMDPRIWTSGGPWIQQSRSVDPSVWRQRC